MVEESEWKPVKVSGKKFLKIKCPDCGHEQITYYRVAMEVTCQVCGSPLAKPTGGYAMVRGDIVGVYE